jgi:hypothetical protein
LTLCNGGAEGVGKVVAFVYGIRGGGIEVTLGTRSVYEGNCGFDELVEVDDGKYLCVEKGASSPLEV